MGGGNDAGGMMGGQMMGGMGGMMGGGMMRKYDGWRDKHDGAVAV